MKNVIFLGSKSVGAECLQELILQAHSCQAQVIGVLTNGRSLSSNNDEPTVLSVAHENDIPVFDQPEDLLKLDTPIDFLISVQYHLILKADILNLAQVAAVNLHMAPLPDYRGCNQFSFAIIDQAKEFGTTLHLMTPGIDDGAIIAESRWKLPHTETVKSLYEKTLNESISLFRKSIKSILSNDFEAVSQENLIGERTSNFHLRNEINQLKEIDLSWPEEKIDRHIRATYFPPFDPPFAYLNGKKIALTFDWKKDIACA